MRSCFLSARSLLFGNAFGEQDSLFEVVDEGLELGDELVRAGEHGVADVEAERVPFDAQLETEHLGAEASVLGKQRLIAAPRLAQATALEAPAWAIENEVLGDTEGRVALDVVDHVLAAMAQHDHLEGEVEALALLGDDPAWASVGGHVAQRALESHANRGRADRTPFAR